MQDQPQPADTFAARARARMAALGLGQREVAERLGYARATSISRWLTGQTSPTEDVIYRWARALECAPRELIAEVVPPTGEGVQ